jgi:hypothetical protein
MATAPCDRLNAHRIPNREVIMRVIKRVPMDFHWPLGELWPGGQEPQRLEEETPCPAGPACLSGVTAARAWVEEIAQLLLNLDDDYQYNELPAAVLRRAKQRKFTVRDVRKFPYHFLGTARRSICTRRPGCRAATTGTASPASCPYC